MMGYIGFVFSAAMFVCAFVKDVSGTTRPRILKIGTNIGCDWLYCVKENQPPPTYHSLYSAIFLSLQLKFMLQKKCDGYIVFVFSVNMLMCSYVCKLFFVKDFSGTTGLRILNLVQMLDITLCIL